MIKNLLIISGYIFLSILIFSCSKSEGSPESKFFLNASFTFAGTNNWPQRYSVTLGVFSKDTINPVVYKTMDKPEETALVSTQLENISSQATLVKLYIANSAHQPIFTLFRKAIDATGQQDLAIPQEAVTLLSYKRVQSQVFSNCIVCHGGSSGEPAAGLSLMSGPSYDNLVNHIATNSAKDRVEPGSVENSFIIEVLRKKQSIFVHSASNTIDEEDIELLENWIMSNAPNN